MPTPSRKPLWNDLQALYRPLSCPAAVQTASQPCDDQPIVTHVQQRGSSPTGS